MRRFAAFQPFHHVSRRFAAASPPMQGALYMTVAAFFFAMMNTCVRLSADTGMDPAQIAFFRNAFALSFMLPWLVRTRFAGARTKRLGQHFWRAFIGLASMYFWFLSVSLLPMAQAVALNFTFPLFGTILAALVLKEVVRLRRWTATLVGFAGVLVVLRPWSEPLTVVALLPVLSALFMACSSILVKSLSRTEAPGTVVFYMNFFMTPLSLIPAAFVWQWPDAWTWGIVVLLGFFAAVSHIALTRAYVRADASVVQPFDYLRMPFIAAIGYFLFGEVPDVWLWLGAGIIAGSTLYIARREAQLARRQRAADLRGTIP